MARARGHGQFCPVAKASEIVAERWTPLVLRELLAGQRTWNGLRRGIPLISPAVLAQRLRRLLEARVIARRRAGAGWEYAVTPAGQELRPLIELLGAWGQRWALDEIRSEDLDPTFLMEAIRRGIAAGVLAAGQLVLSFELTGERRRLRRWWLLVDRGEVELCLRDPERPVDLEIVATARVLAELILGRLSPDEALRSGAVILHGAEALAREFATWFPRSRFAVHAPQASPP